MDYLVEEDRFKYSTLLGEIARIKVKKNEDLDSLIGAAFPPITGTDWTATIVHALTMHPQLTDEAKQEASVFLRRALHQWTTSSSYVQWHEMTPTVVRIVNGLLEGM